MCEFTISFFEITIARFGGSCFFTDQQAVVALRVFAFHAQFNARSAPFDGQEMNSFVKFGVVRIAMYLFAAFIADASRQNQGNRWKKVKNAGIQGEFKIVGEKIFI